MRIKLYFTTIKPDRIRCADDKFAQTRVDVVNATTSKEVTATAQWGATATAQWHSPLPRSLPQWGGGHPLPYSPPPRRLLHLDSARAYGAWTPNFKTVVAPLLSCTVFEVFDVE